jgi:hypothetical protein
MMFLSFQTNADRWLWTGSPRVHGRFVGIVAFGTGEDDPVILPAAYPLSMAAEKPVFLTIGMAGAANEVRLIEIDLLVT